MRGLMKVDLLTQAMRYGLSFGWRSGIRHAAESMTDLPSEQDRLAADLHKNYASQLREANEHLNEILEEELGKILENN